MAFFISTRMKILQHYTPQSEKEKYFKSKMLELYETKGNLAFQRQNLDAHFTASALIISPTTQEILLLHHKKLDKWLQPGGHADGELDLEKVARKEASEETGHDDLQLLSEGIFDIDIHSIPEKKGIPEHEHYDVRFAYFCHNKEKTRINSESNDFQWVKIEKVKTLSNEPSIIRMIEKCKSILDGK